MAGTTVSFRVLSMNPAEFPKYDFRAASKLERPLALPLNAWFSKFNRLFVERWEDFASSEIHVTSIFGDSLSFESARIKWSNPTVACPVTVKSLDRKTEVQGLLVAECADVIIVVMEILSEGLSARPADRELTSIELTMCQLLFQTSVSVLSEAWLDKETLPISLGEFDFEPNNSRLFTPNKEVVVKRFEIRTSSSSMSGPAKFDWVFGKNELIQLLGVRNPPQLAASPNKLDADLVSQLEVQASVTLGTAELSMDALMQLTPGAIVKLNQRVDEPLSLSLNGQTKLVGWPGKSNQNHCLLVESFLN
jgi:flagellar motor switch protein FliM